MPALLVERLKELAPPAIPGRFTVVGLKLEAYVIRSTMEPYAMVMPPPRAKRTRNLEAGAVYKSPKLMEYGSLRDVTLSVSTSLTGDNVQKTNNKTI